MKTYDDSMASVVDGDNNNTSKLWQIRTNNKTINTKIYNDIPLNTDVNVSKKDVFIVTYAAEVHTARSLPTKT